MKRILPLLLIICLLCHAPALASEPFLIASDHTRVIAQIAAFIATSSAIWSNPENGPNGNSVIYNWYNKDFETLQDQLWSFFGDDFDRNYVIGDETIMSFLNQLNLTLRRESRPAEPFEFAKIVEAIYAYLGSPVDANMLAMAYDAMYQASGHASLAHESDDLVSIFSAAYNTALAGGSEDDIYTAAIDAARENRNDLRALIGRVPEAAFLREFPSLSSMIIGRVPFGATVLTSTVEYDDEHDISYTNVTYENGELLLTGWVASSLLFPVGTPLAEMRPFRPVDPPAVTTPSERGEPEDTDWSSGEDETFTDDLHYPDQPGDPGNLDGCGCGMCAGDPGEACAIAECGCF